jgi:putative ABC transport system ATP-binding protein
VFVLENVLKRYSLRGHEVVAFRAERLELAGGVYHAVVGPSGSGKTTLLSLLGGMLSPDEGKVSLDGQSLYDLPIEERTALRRSLIGFVFQTFNLVPYLTALENVQLPLYLAGVTPQQQVERATELLTQLGLEERLDHKPCELSIGQQQRVALARTLANAPSVILADEPTGNLDPESRAMVLDYFEAFHSLGNTIVMVTHDMAAADRAQQRWLLKAGELASVSEPIRWRRSA